MNDHEDGHTLPLTPIENIPFLPARAGHAGEEACLHLWQRFAERAPEDFRAVFSSLPYEWNQRAASVAASFSCWLGTNIGSAYVEAAGRAWAAGPATSSGEAYVAAWAVANRRVSYANSGLRLCEYILAERPMPSGTGFDGVGVGLQHRPTVTLDDLDVIECIVVWLATAQGAAYIAAARQREQAANAASKIWGD